MTQAPIFKAELEIDGSFNVTARQGHVMAHIPASEEGIYTHEARRKHANVIAEAFDVLLETSMTPKQLLTALNEEKRASSYSQFSFEAVRDDLANIVKQRDELIVFLREISNCIERDMQASLKNSQSLKDYIAIAIARKG